MKRGSTNILRITVILMGLVVLGLCLATSPALFRGDLDEFTPILIGLYLTALPFFFALGQTLKLLKYIDCQQVFSALSVEALRKVKISALMITGLYTLGFPYVFMLADRDDAPGLAALGLILIGASFVIATSAGVLQKLLQSAIDIKSENDLTV